MLDQLLQLLLVELVDELFVVNRHLLLVAQVFLSVVEVGDGVELLLLRWLVLKHLLGGPGLLAPVALL